MSSSWKRRLSCLCQELLTELQVVEFSNHQLQCSPLQDQDPAPQACHGLEAKDCMKSPMTCSGIAVRISPCHPRAEEHSIDLKQSPQSDTMSTIVLAEIPIEICAFRWWSREESRRPSQYLAFRQSSKFPQNYDLLWVVYSRCSSPAQTGDEQQRCNFVWLKTSAWSYWRQITWHVWVYIDRFDDPRKKTSSIVANLISFGWQYTNHIEVKV